MPRFSKAVSSLRSSEIRDLMTLASRPHIISFAGGMPGNDLFPVQEIEDLFKGLDIKKKRIAFQYGPTPGLPSLLESLSGFFDKKGCRYTRTGCSSPPAHNRGLICLAKPLLTPTILSLSKIPALSERFRLSAPMMLN